MRHQHQQTETEPRVSRSDRRRHHIDMSSNVLQNPNYKTHGSDRIRDVSHMIFFPEENYISH
jgi:hypothetical protein